MARAPLQQPSQENYWRRWLAAFVRDSLSNALPRNSTLGRLIMAPRVHRSRSAPEAKAFHVDAVTDVALEELTEHVFRPLHIQSLVLEKRDLHVTDRSARAAVIHTLRMLDRGGHELVPENLQRWALARGWPDPDAQLLRDYADGVKVGVRYHTGPNPFGPEQYDRWVKVAARSDSWQR